MGGSLIATSDGPGRGACFTLTLPLRISREPS
jgi:signal transduction histidine kinase